MASNDDNRKDLEMLRENQRQMEAQFRENIRLQQYGQEQADGTFRPLDPLTREQVVKENRELRFQLNSYEKTIRELQEHMRTQEPAEQERWSLTPEHERRGVKLENQEQDIKTLQKTVQALDARYAMEMDALAKTNDLDGRRKITEIANQTRLEIKAVEDNIQQLQKNENSHDR